MEATLRSIPSVDKCLKELFEQDCSFQSAPQALLKDLVISFWNQKRAAVKAGKYTSDLSLESQLGPLTEFVHKGLSPHLRRVINAAGVIIHTNLGRSILAGEASKAVAMAASGYCNLEMDLESGERGSRNSLVSNLVCALTGAEAAMVVNNNAAAVLLILDTLCSGGETIVSRGELVEIGGSFRIPDIMRKSGAILREVGTTNRTHPDDYRQAINEQTKAIMRVHASNFRITGFHSAVDLKSLKTMAVEHDLPLIVDLGSGSLLDLADYGLPPEPVVKDVLSQGADVVCFSGDKVLGGPQAGIIAGRADIVEKLKRNPLARCLRCDKLCLAALEATLRLYLKPTEAIYAVPTLEMITRSQEELAVEARMLAARIKRELAKSGIDCRVERQGGESRIGGGSFPEYGLPTILVKLIPANISAAKLRKHLLEAEIPVIGRIEKDAFCLDPRTLARADYPVIASLLRNALENAAKIPAIPKEGSCADHASRAASREPSAC